MKTVREFVNEGKDEATAIRNILKKEYKLSSRDVGVKTDYGGTSSSVDMNIKTKNGLLRYRELENITSKFEKIDWDEASGEILSGGNTFITVNVDWKFKNKLTDVITSIVKKEATEDFLNNDKTSIKIFGVYHIFKDGNTYQLVGSHSNSVSKLEHISSIIFHRILNDDKNGKKIIKKYL